MSYFAVRHRESGEFWPETKGGYTSWSPPSSRHAALNPPRLFPNYRSAACAVGQWARGEFMIKFSGDFEAWYEPRPIEGRSADTLEIVEVLLTERRNHQFPEEVGA